MHRYKCFGRGNKKQTPRPPPCIGTQIPVDERAEFVWQLSLELHTLAHPGRPYEPRLLNLLRALSAADARFMIVGAYAVGVHGWPRAIRSRRAWVATRHQRSRRLGRSQRRECPSKVMSALREFGAPLMGLIEADLREPGVGLQIGVDPGRIDILTAISGVRFEEAWPSKFDAQFGDDVRCAVIGLDELLRNERAAARPQDLADVAATERLRRGKV